MSDVLDLEKRDVPGSVSFAGMIGLAKAIFEGGFGLLGLAIADSIDDSFGGGMLLFGIVFAIASLLLLRGSRVGYYLTLVLSAIGLVIGLVYLTDANDATLGAAIVIAFFNALVLYLLLGTKSAREFFSRRNVA
jgi:hypothetical protein